MRHCLLFESIPYIPYWCHQSSLVHRVCFNLHLKTVLHKTIPSLQSEMCYKLQCPAVFYGHLAFTNTESVRPIFFKDKHLEEEQVGYRHWDPPTGTAGEKQSINRLIQCWFWSFLRICGQYENIEYQRSFPLIRNKAANKICLMHNKINKTLSENLQLQIKDQIKSRTSSAGILISRNA